MRPNWPPPITPKVSGSVVKEGDDTLAAQPPGNKDTEFVMPFMHRLQVAVSWLLLLQFDLF
jgi:hypothetical protein